MISVICKYKSYIDISTSQVYEILNAKVINHLLLKESIEKSLLLLNLLFISK